MRQRLAATIGAIVTISLFLLTNAKRLADAIAIVHLPHDVGEVLTSMSQVSALVSNLALAVGLICLAYLIATHWRLGSKPLNQKMDVGNTPPPISAAPAASKFDPKWTRDVSLIDAIWRAHLGRWNDRIAYLQDDWKSAGPFHQVTSDIRQKAFEGLLPIWSTRPRSNLYELVPPEFWRNHDIQASYMIHPKIIDTWVYVTHPLVIGEVPNARTKAWENFMTNREVIEQLWPAKPDAPSKKVPLIDAVRSVQQQTRGSRIEAIANRRYATIPDGIWSYYAYQLVSVIPLYGKPSPSPDYQTIPDEVLHRFDLTIENGQFVAKERNGNAILADLAIAETDLAAGVVYLKSFDALDFLKDDGI